MKKLINNKHILHVLKNCKPKLRKVIIENANTETVKAIAEIAKNTLNGVTKIQNTKFFKKLKSYKRALRILSSRNVKLSVKRQLLSSAGKLVVLLLESIFSGEINEIIEKGSI